MRLKLGNATFGDIALCCAAAWTVRRVIRKYLDSVAVWCWRRRETMIWTDGVDNEVIQRQKE
jgi:hypothetical protein